MIETHESTYVKNPPLLPSPHTHIVGEGELPLIIKLYIYHSPSLNISAPL